MSIAASASPPLSASVTRPKPRWQDAAVWVTGDPTRARLVIVDKYRVVTFVQKRLVNPVVRSGLQRGVRVPGYALLETIGRKSGLPRTTPVGDGLEGSTFWIVSEHGRRSAYVRNIEANPRVRVRVRGRWRTGTAHVLPDDDPRERQRLLSHRLGARINAASVRGFGTDLTSVRIDLDD
jgi:deazaflavin-dependent oxidoreductase (nitroreductase family)